MAAVPPTVTFYLSDLDSQATAGLLTLGTAVMDTPEFDFAVDVSVPKTDLNLFNYTLHNENWASENPDAQDISITFPDYATSAFVDLNNYGDYVVDRVSGQNAGITSILTDYSTSDECGIALLNNVRLHYGHPKVLSIFSDENTVKSALKTAINNAFAAKVAANNSALTGSFSFVQGDNDTANNAVKSLLRIIAVDSTRLTAFQEENTVGFADLLREGDIIQVVVDIIENPLQLNLDGTTPSDRKSTRMLIRLNVTNAAPAP